MNKRLRLGIIGFSEANGHPYSFSSIINGYSSTEYDSDWSLIRDYLHIKPSQDFLSDFAVVESVWCDDFSRANSILISSGISKVCSNYDEMLDLDGVILARDDWRERNKILDFSS